MANFEERRQKNTISLFSLINIQPDIDKIYSYGEDPNKAKHQLLIRKQEGAGLSNCNNAKTFIEYSTDLDLLI